VVSTPAKERVRDLLPAVTPQPAQTQPSLPAAIETDTGVTATILIAMMKLLCATPSRRYCAATATSAGSGSSTEALELARQHQGHLKSC